MPCNIFTYGSLIFPSVCARLVRRSYSFARAVLADHARYAVAGESYPGMVMQAGGGVEGILYFDVHAADLARLDDFEGPDYRRVAVLVQLPDGTRAEAQTYLCRHPQHLLHTDWNAEEFDLPRFLAHTVRRTELTS